MPDKVLRIPLLQLHLFREDHMGALRVSAS